MKSYIPVLVGSLLLSSAIIFGDDVKNVVESPVQTEELVSLHNIENFNDCYAVFKGTVLRGEKFPVDKVTYEGSGIMVKYHSEEKGSWYYSTSFENLICS